jgi:SpoVK/Ycf46/Vps4 family AAA+-type ATPase
VNSCSKEILYDDIYANHESSELTSVAILLDKAIVGQKIGLLSSFTEAGVVSPPLSPIRVQFDGRDSEKKPESGSRAKEFNSKVAADSGMVFVIAATNRPDLLDPGNPFRVLHCIHNAIAYP